MDVLGDPTNLIPFGAAKAAVKPFSRGVLKLAKYLAPETKAILGMIPEAEHLLKPTEKAILAMADVDTLGFKGAADAVGHITTTIPGLRAVFPDDLTKPVKNWSEDAIDVLRSYLRQVDANFRPDIQNSIQSFAQTFAERMLPVGFTLKNFSHSGRELAERYERAILRARRGAETWTSQLDYLRKFAKKDRQDMTYIIEGLHKGDVSQDVLDAAMAEEGILRRFGETVKGFRDEWDDGLKVFDTHTGDWEPFEMLPGYFPHRWRPEDLTPTKLNKFKDEMRARGMSEVQIHRIMDRMGVKPKRVGNLEMKRHPGMVGYMTDPLEVLPKYFHDSLTRMELAREFGTDSRRLDMLVSNLVREGFDETWAKRIADMMVGRNIYDRGMLDNVAPTLATVQAISKLGFATSVANISQGPLNQYAMSGNFVKSMLKAGVPTPGGAVLGGNLRAARIGGTAFGRAFRDDLYRFGTGVRNRLSEFYMRGIGFNWTERMGRHIGAMGGELDASALYEAYRLNRATNPKTAGRFLSELERKYKVALRDPYDTYRTVEDMAEMGPTGMSVGTMAAQLGRLPDNVLEHAGIVGADTVMHAFGPMDLPQAWRSPNIKLLMQFKSFIYKQMGFLYSQVMAPGIQYFATDGAKGSVGPLLRFALAMPVGAEAVAHLRDVAKSLPSQVYTGVTKGELADWEYKDPFWRDPDPGWRLFRDMTYIGLFGIVGDVMEAANQGRLLRYVAGPTVTDLTDYLEAISGEMDVGKQLTRQLPGFLGLPYSANIFD